MILSNIPSLTSFISHTWQKGKETLSWSLLTNNNYFKVITRKGTKSAMMVWLFRVVASTPLSPAARTTSTRPQWTRMHARRTCGTLVHGPGGGSPLRALHAIIHSRGYCPSLDETVCTPNTPTQGTRSRNPRRSPRAAISSTYPTWVGDSRYHPSCLRRSAAVRTRDGGNTALLSQCTGANTGWSVSPVSPVNTRLPSYDLIRK